MQQFPLTVYVNKKAINGGTGDYQIKIVIPLLSTSLSIIKTILHSDSIKIQDSNPFNLYLTQLLLNEKDQLHRKFIRILDHTEYPLLLTDLSSNYMFPPYTLYLTRSTAELDPNTFNSTFHLLRKEQCKTLPIEVLKKRLDDIDNDEHFDLNDAKANLYTTQRMLEGISNE